MPTTVLNINWGAAVFVPPVPASQVAPSVYMNVVDDNSIVIINDGTSRIAGNPGYWDAYVVDFSGAYTWYRSEVRMDFNTQGADSIANPVPLGNGAFLFFMKNGTPLQWFPQFQNLKINNATKPLTVPLAVQIAANVCINFATSNIVNYYYDTYKKLFAVAAYPNGGATGPIWSTVYNTRQTSRNLLTQGYAGQKTVGIATDPFYQATAIAIRDPTRNWTLSSNRTMTNGSVNQSFLANAGPFSYGIALGQYQITAGQTNIPPCSTAQPANGSNVNWKLPPTFVDTQGNGIALFDTNIPGIILFQYNGTGYARMVDMATVPPNPDITQSNNWYDLTQFGPKALTNKYYFGVITNGFPYPNGVYVAINPNIGPSPAASGPNNNGAFYTSINHARPISLTGRYKA